MSVRCMQPAQQHGRRIPSFNSETTLVTCSFRVSGVLTEIVQQIHSLRASGVISSHAANALESDRRAFRKSAGSSCATPPEIFFAILLVYKIGVPTGNRTLIESSTSSSVNRYTIGTICANKLVRIFLGAQERTRTSNPLRGLPPQGSASTSFATCAYRQL